MAGKQINYGDDLVTPVGNQQLTLPGTLKRLPQDISGMARGGAPEQLGYLSSSSGPLGLGAPGRMKPVAVPLCAVAGV